MEAVKSQISFNASLLCHGEVTDFSIHLILKFKQYQNANIANFVYYGKTQINALPNCCSLIMPIENSLHEKHVKINDVRTAGND